MRAKYLKDEPGSNPEEISDLIGAVLETVSVGADVRHSQIVDEWERLAPGDWADATPVGVKEGVLLVRVSDGARASLLKYQTEPLVDAIERRIGAGVVTGVRIAVERSGYRENR